MSYLLDSHVFLWWLEDSPRLSLRMRGAIAAPRETIYVSAATIWELSLKVSIGRLSIKGAMANRLNEQIEACGFAELPVSAAHAAAAARLPQHHADPFDRMLVAQANSEGATLISADKAMARYQVSLLES